MNIKMFSVLLSFLLLFNSFVPIAYCASATNQQIEQGNKYAKIGHDAYKLGNHLKAAENYEKAYQITKYSLYLDNSLVAYTSYAYNLTNDKQYDEAIKYCNKVLSLRSNDKNARELLSDIYFSRGADYFYSNDLEKAKSDFQISLKYSSLEEQIERANDGLSKIDDALKNKIAVIPKYQETSDISIPEIVSKIENKIYGNSNKKGPLLDRINKLENDALGKNYTNDSLIIRVDRLKRAVLPEYASQTSDSRTQFSEYGNTYIPEIIEQSRGKVTIIGNNPIAVYIDENKVKSLRKSYRDAAIEGFKEWEKASDGRIKFEFVYDQQRADLKVAWCEEFQDFQWKPTLEKEDLSAEKQRMKYQKASTIVRIGSVLAMVAGSMVGIPVVGSMGAIGSSVASPILQYKGIKTENLSHDIKINTKITEGMDDNSAKIKIKQIATHQMGHALGIFGHSYDLNDIMCENFTVTQLSERDINTIKEIYKSKEPEKN